MTWMKRWFCKHSFVFERNVYADEILAIHARSIWTCSKCGKVRYWGFLHNEESEEPSDERQPLSNQVGTLQSQVATLTAEVARLRELLQSVKRAEPLWLPQATSDAPPDYYEEVVALFNLSKRIAAALADTEPEEGGK